MNKKIIRGATLISVLSLFALTACASTPDPVTFKPVWNANSYATDDISGTNEVLKYTLSLTAGENKNATLKDVVGEYVLTLTNAPYEGEMVYKLTGELTLSGTYELGAQTKAFTDSMSSVCYFRESSRSYFPLYSTKTVVSTTPVKENASTLDELLTTYSFTVETKYGSDGSALTSGYTDGVTGEKKDSKLKLRADGPVIDNEALLFAIRSMTVSSTAKYLSVYDPFTNALNRVGVKLGEQKKQTYAFQSGVGTPGATEEKELDTTEVIFGLSADFAGKTQTATFVANEGYRVVPVALSTPLTYGFGTLNYTLTSATFANK